MKIPLADGWCLERVSVGLGRVFEWVFVDPNGQRLRDTPLHKAELDVALMKVPASAVRDIDAAVRRFHHDVYRPMVRAGNGKIHVFCGGPRERYPGTPLPEWEGFPVVWHFDAQAIINGIQALPDLA